MPIPVLEIKRSFRKYQRFSNKDFESIILAEFKNTVMLGVKPLLMQLLSHWNISESEKENSFDYIWKTRGKDWKVEIRISNKVLGFIEGGTSERWAVMQKSFVPKTRVGTIPNVRGGSSTPRIRGAAMIQAGMHPRQGIKARNRLPIVRKISNPRFRARMKNAVKRAKRKAGFK